MENNLCPECNNPLQYKRDRFESAEGSTDVYVILDGLCVNPKCSNYCGPNLNEPAKAAATVRNKVN